MTKTSSRKIVDYTEEVEIGCTDPDKSFYYEIIDDLKSVLSEDEINVILLHAVYGHPFTDIARKYGRKTTTVKSVYHRAIKKYRKTRGIKQ